MGTNIYSISIYSSYSSTDNRGNRKALKGTHNLQHSSCQNENIFKYIHFYLYKVCIFEKEIKFPF